MSYGDSTKRQAIKAGVYSDPKHRPDPLPPDTSDTGTPFDSTKDPSSSWDTEVADIPGGADHPGRGLTVVNVQAIKNFAANIETLLPLIDTMVSELDGVRIGAGYLGAGHNLHNTILGANQLRDSSRKVLVDSKNALMRISTACEEIASRYATAEDLNAMDAQAFQRQVAAAKGAINSLTL